MSLYNKNGFKQQSKNKVSMCLFYLQHFGLNLI